MSDSSQSDSDDSQLSPAAQAFGDFLHHWSLDKDADFEAFCAERRALEEDLRSLYHAWRMVSRVLGATLDGESVARFVESAYGGRVDPEMLARLVVHSGPRPRYEIRDEIERGGMGTILRVRDNNVGRDLAMKRVGGRGSPGRDVSVQRVPGRTLARFLEEARITGQLEHPGIVPVHEIGIDEEEHAYFTMQLVRGRDFQRIIKLIETGKEGWTTERGLGVLIRVCEAMAYAHAKGVIHRDLKPTNVMVGRFGETYVMDWGLARIIGEDDTKDIRIRHAPLSSERSVAAKHTARKGQAPDSPLLTVDGDVLGTPCYMAPEQAMGKLDEVGPRSDVYSVGAMLYHLITGQPPYMRRDAKSPHMVLDLVLAGPPAAALEVRPSANAELAEICAKAMARDPRKRYADTMEMAHDIEAYLGRRPISPRKPTLAYVVRLAIQRNKAVAVTVAAALLIVIAVVAADLMQVRAARDRARRLLDFRSAQVLLGQAEHLYPSTPATLPAIRQWLDETGQRLERIEKYRTQCAALGGTDESVEAVTLRTGVDYLEKLERLRPAIAARAETASKLRERSIAEHQDEWDRAIAAIQSSPKYGGLALSPQLGLVPLGLNQQGYWEFWHVLSGDRPQRSERGDCFHVGAGSGVVLVLLPGGEFTMGSPAGERTRVQNEELRNVSLPPFFLSTHEVTQGQWERIMGSNPSLYSPGTVVLETASTGKRELKVSALHPVESISWEHSVVCAKRIDLRLPREAEWEYACRAGTRTAYFWGQTADCMKGHENVRDLSYSRLAPRQEGANWRDGYAIHAPVGSFSPNAFGLFDMHGNVSEWCEDPYRSADPPDDRARRRVFRGGSWYHQLIFLRSAFRQYDDPRGLNQTRGVRFARSVRKEAPGSKKR